MTPQFEAGRWAVWGAILAQTSSLESGPWVRVSGLRPLCLTVETVGTPASMDLRIFATNAKDPPAPSVHPGSQVHDLIIAGGAYFMDGPFLWIRAEVFSTDVPVEVNVFAG